MTLSNLIDKHTFQVKWNYVITIPEFKKLEEGGYHSMCHREGNSLQHTKNVVNSLYSLEEWKTLNEYDKIVLVMAALFHDIGKSSCNKQKTDGNWSAYNHENIGEKITRYLLWDVRFCDKQISDIEIRELICSLVKYHMRPKFLLKKKDYNDICGEIIKISQETRWDLLCILCKCDKLGSECDDLEEGINVINELKKKCIDLDCFNKPYFNNIRYSSHNEHTFYEFFNHINKEKWHFIGRYPKFTCFIMCGVSGSGKSYYIENTLKELYLPIVSRDKIRVDLGYCSSTEKLKGNNNQENKVTEIENNLINQYCFNQQSFIIDNINIRKKYRDKIIQTVVKYGGRVEIIYVETYKENNINRRKDMVNEQVIEEMQKTIDFPTSTECHRLTILKN